MALGQPWHEWVDARRAEGLSWYETAERLKQEAGDDAVSYESLRRWYGQHEAAKAAA